MKFFSLKVDGALRIEIEPFSDERGLFTRTFCQNEFLNQGIEFPVSQCSTSFNKESGTLRGMHYQKQPAAEKKLVRCTMGAVYDVILDLRPESPTFLKWDAVTLTAENRMAVYIPEGVAHGFQTLAPCSEVFYQMSVPYSEKHYAGVRWNDPVFGIVWPDCDRRNISLKDASHSDFKK